MSQIRSYRDLLVWQKSIALVTNIYTASTCFPKDEVYGLSAQLRRCAVSVPSNIAEGHGRATRKSYLRYLEISLGSLFELQTQLLIASNLNYLESDSFSRLEEAERMLTGLMRSLRKKPSA